MNERALDKENLRVEIEDLFERDLTERERERALVAIEQLLEGLESGELRTAEKAEDFWRANAWVKKGILLAFRTMEMRDYSINRHFQYRDKEMLGPLPWIGRNATLRVVPGGTMLRRGSYIGQNVIIMPPAYVNIGAYVGDGSLIDSHALVGSCAQIGAGVHLSAGAQIGGVLEPVGTTPVVIEDGAFIGGNTGIYEGTQVGEGAVIGAGVILTASTPIYDLPNERLIKPTVDRPLVVPEYAIVVPGSRPAKGQFAEENNVQLQTPVIIKYREPEESPLLALESALR